MRCINTNCKHHHGINGCHFDDKPTCARFIPESEQIASAPVESPSAGSVPLWSECSEKVDLGEKLTALETFVYNNEPAHPHGLSFREELSAALKEQNIRSEGCGKRV